MGGASYEEETTTSIRRALAEQDATIAKLEANATRLGTAIRNANSRSWDHGENCPHYGCVSPEDCETRGIPCDCYVRDIRALAALLPAVPS